MIRRPPTLARNGMVVSSHPLASEAGTLMLREGGHAVDAAVAAAAVLAVVEPWSGGIGGDAFLLIHDTADGGVTAINGNGAAPSGLDAAVFSGHSRIPADGLASATVPGCVDAWYEAWYGWGRLGWSQILGPAVMLAREGYPVSWNMARILRRERQRLAKDPGLRSLFLHPDLSPLSAGEICRPNALGSVLEGIAAKGSEWFYSGPAVRRLCRAVRDAGGVLNADDFSRHESRLLPAYEHTAGDCVCYQQPLPSQGILLLLMLSLMEDGDFGGLSVSRSAHELHMQIQACCVARAIRDLLLGDPSRLPVEEQALVGALLDPLTVRRLAGLIMQEPIDPGLWRQVVQEALWEPECPLAPIMTACGVDQDRGPTGGDTTYLCAADRFGNVVGLIQSIFSPFGCGFLDPRTGIVLNNRASAFSLDPLHPNRLEPGKRPFHTLNSTIVMRDGRPVLVCGTPGADRQIQTSLQVLRHIRAGRILWTGPMPMKPGNWNQRREPEESRAALGRAELLAAALEAPRWGLLQDGRVEFEARMPSVIRERLRRMGHGQVRTGPWSGSGRMQAIGLLDDGVLCGATDPRAEGAAIGF